MKKAHLVLSMPARAILNDWANGPLPVPPEWERFKPQGLKHPRLMRYVHDYVRAINASFGGRGGVQHAFAASGVPGLFAECRDGAVFCVVPRVTFLENNAPPIISPDIVRVTDDIAAKLKAMHTAPN